MVLDRNRGGAYLSTLIVGAGLFGIFLFLSYYLQLTLGYSPLVTGVAFLPFSAGSAAASNLATIVLMPRVGPRPLVAGGMLAAAARRPGWRSSARTPGTVRAWSALLRHRLWPPDRQWGFSTGYANKGERHEDTIAREVREETGLTVKAGRLLKVRSGFRYRIEVYYETVLVGGLDGLTLDPKEVLAARLFSPGDLPDRMPEVHRELAASL